MAGEEDVQYDNAAFGYFMLSGLFLYIIPASIYTLVRIWRVFRGSNDVDASEVRAVWLFAFFVRAARLWSPAFVHAAARAVHAHTPLHRFLACATTQTRSKAEAERLQKLQKEKLTMIYKQIKIY